MTEALLNTNREGYKALSDVSKREVFVTGVMAYQMSFSLVVILHEIGHVLLVWLAQGLYVSSFQIGPYSGTVESLPPTNLSALQRVVPDIGGMLTPLAIGAVLLCFRRSRSPLFAFLSGSFLGMGLVDIGLTMGYEGVYGDKGSDMSAILRRFGLLGEPEPSIAWITLGVIILMLAAWTICRSSRMRLRRFRPFVTMMDVVGPLLVFAVVYVLVVQLRHEVPKNAFGPFQEIARVLVTIGIHGAVGLSLGLVLINRRIARILISYLLFFVVLSSAELITIPVPSRSAPRTGSEAGPLRFFLEEGTSAYLEANYERSAEMYGEAYRRAPNQIAIAMNYAMALFQIEEHDHARVVLERAQKNVVDPGKPAYEGDIAHWLGRVELALGNRERACRFFQKQVSRHYTERVSDDPKPYLREACPDSQE